MNASLTLETVRRQVRQMFANLGHSHADWPHVRETMLISDLTHTGCRFQCDGIRAVWYGDSGVVEVFSEDGHPLQRISLSAPEASGQRAA